MGNPVAAQQQEPIVELVGQFGGTVEAVAL